MFYIIYKETRKEPFLFFFFCLCLSFFSRKPNQKPKVIRLVTGPAALFACSSGCINRLLIAVSKKPVCLCARKTQSTQTANFHCCRDPSVFPSHVPRCPLRAFVLSGSCLETNRRLSEHTNTQPLIRGLCLGPSCRKHDTSEDAKTNPKRG